MKTCFCLLPFDLLEKNLFKRNVIENCELKRDKVLVKVCTSLKECQCRRKYCNFANYKLLKCSLDFVREEAADAGAGLLGKNVNEKILKFFDFPRISQVCEYF